MFWALQAADLQERVNVLEAILDEGDADTELLAALECVAELEKKLQNDNQAGSHLQKVLHDKRKEDRRLERQWRERPRPTPGPENFIPQY